MSAGGAEREARELAEQIDLIEYGPIHRGFFEIEDVTELLAKALEKCANEARLEALEQAAATVETMKFESGDSWGCFMAPSHEAEELAAAIRALKEAK